MSSLAVYIDLGSSQTRVLWSHDGQDLKLVTYSSDCSPSLAEADGLVEGISSFWLSTPRTDPFVVGAEAADYPLANEIRERFKFEVAIPKILAGLHAAFVGSGASKTSALELCLLLPFNEHQSFSVLQKGLEKSAADFTCNGSHYCLNFQRIECLSEGSGILRHLTRKYPNFAGKTILTVMLGYRDSTLILSRGGREVLDVKSAKLGLLAFLKGIEKRVGDIDRFRAAELFYRTGGRIHARTCKSIARTTSKEMAAMDAKSIADAARASKKFYQSSIDDFTQTVPLDSIDYVFVGGGTAEVMRDYLEKLFGEDRVYYPDTLTQQIQNHLGVDRSQAVRLVDIYAIARLKLDELRVNAPATA